MNKIERLKRERQAKLAEMQNQAQKEKKGNRDDRFWKPGFDSEKKVGGARIRFLPAPDGESHAWVKMFTHFIRNNGKFYVENSLTTLGQKDPVSEMNTRLWATEKKSDRDMVSRNLKRKMAFISNILVINDPYNRENEGKVFLYEYGMKIHNKILTEMGLLERDELDEGEPYNPFDFWSGADFRIKIKQDGPNKRDRNYNDSHFEAQSELYDGDPEKLEEVWEQCYSLEAFYADDNFKSYEELQRRIFEVMGPYVGSGVEVVEGWGKGVPKDSGKSSSDTSSTDTRERLKNRKGKKKEEEPESSDEDGEENEDHLRDMLNGEDDDDEDSPEPEKSSSDDDDDDEDYGFLGDEFG